MSAKAPARSFDKIMKLLLVGDSGVGKLCLLLRFVEDKFLPSFVTTIGIDFKVKTITTESGQKIKLQIWDTAGQERFRTITLAYYRGASAVIIVYDCTDGRSFENVTQWQNTVQQCANEDAVIFLVGNKCDDDAGRVVNKEEGQALATRLNMPFLEALAKTNENVEAIFYEVAKLVLEKDVSTPTTLGGVDVSKTSESGSKNNCC